MKRQTVLSKTKVCAALSLIVMVLIATSLAGSVLGSSSAFPGDTPSVLAINKALAYLDQQQQTDGSYLDFDGPINATNGAALAVISAGLDINEWTKSNTSTIDFLLSQKELLSDPADADANSAKIAQLVMVLAASDYDPHDFAGTDWPAILNSTRNATSGAYGSAFIRHPWIILGLKAAGEAIPGNAVTYLTDNQEDNGGFGVNGRGSGSDTNTTAICLEALAAAGQTSESLAVQRAVAFLHTQQNDDGGFPWAKPSPWGTDSDSSSTAWVIQGLIAAGQNYKGADWAPNGRSPLTYLLGMQNPSGAYRYQTSWPDDSLLSTYQVIPALMGKSFPLVYEALSPNTPVFVSLPGNNQPINITEGQTIVTNPYSVEVRPSSPFGIGRVEFYVDGVLIETVYTPNADGVYTFSWDTGKYHSLIRIIAYDASGSQAEISRNTTIALPENDPFLPYTGR